MKYLKFYENFLESMKSDKKIFIQIGSFNSSGVTDTSSDEIKMDAEKSWGMQVALVHDLTTLIEEIYEMIKTIRNRQDREYLQNIFNKMDNIGFTKILAGLIDKVKFQQDYNGFTNEILEKLGKTKTNALLKKIERILRGINKSEEERNIGSEFDFLQRFQSLRIDEKLKLFKELEENPNLREGENSRGGTLVVIRSYIYIVVDESKIHNFIHTLQRIFEDIN
jgi:hypothetical protein